MRSAILSLLLLASQAVPCLAVETLANAWAVAVAQNDGLTASQLRSQAAHYEAFAAASERWPSASVRTGYLARSTQPSFVGSQPSLGAPSFTLPFAQRNAASFSAQASAPLWTGGRIKSSVEAAKSRHAACQEASRWETMQLRMRVAEAYLAVLQEQASLAAAEDLLSSAEAQAKDTGERAQQRRATETEVMASQVTVLEARQQLLMARNRLTDAKASYNQLLARPRFSAVDIVEPELRPLETPLEELTELAVCSRPDLEEIKRTIQAHQSDAAGWRASRLPQVSAEFGFDFEENRFQSPQGIGSAGLFVDWKWLDGGERRHRSSAATTQAAAARAALQERQAQIAVDVLTAWNLREEAWGAEQVSKDALAHRIEHDRLIRQRYAQGLVVAAEKIASQAALAQATARWTHARAGRLLSELNLRFVAGLLDAGCR